MMKVINNVVSLKTDKKDFPSSVFSFIVLSNKGGNLVRQFQFKFILFDQGCTSDDTCANN